MAEVLNLLPHQLEGISFLEKEGNKALFYDTGIGKTVVILSYLKLWVIKNKTMPKVLIIAPLLTCKNTWALEAKKWDQLQNLEVNLFNLKRDINVINPEKLLTKDIRSELKITDFDILIIDESDKFKNPNSKRLKVLLENLNRFKKIIIMTGTPVGNSFLDLWSQIFLLDKGKRLGTSYWYYKQKYFIFNPMNPMVKAKIKPNAEKKIIESIKDIALYKTINDVLDLPSIIYNDIRLELDEKFYKIYDAEFDNLLRVIKNKPIEFLPETSKLLYVRQLANGIVYKDDKSYTIAHRIKLDYLFNLVESLCGNPVLIKYDFICDKEAIKQVLKNRCVVLNDDKKNQDAIIKAWNNKEIPVLLLQPKTASHGLNLQDGGHNIIHFSQNFSATEYKQFNARLHRNGMKNRVMVHNLIARNTIDEIMIKVCRNTNLDFFNELKNYRR